MNDSDPTAPGTPRRIKSFVKREGRLTPGQEKNLAALWPRYGLERPEAPLDWTGVFGRDAHRTLSPRGQHPRGALPLDPR